MEVGILNKEECWEDFRPRDLVTRAELAVMCSRLAEYAAKRGIKLGGRQCRSSLFLDVPSNHWAKKAIDEMARLGVLRSLSDFFHPNDPVTKLELTRWLYALLEPSLGLPPYHECVSVDYRGLCEEDLKIVRAGVAWAIHDVSVDSEKGYISLCTRQYAAWAIFQVITQVFPVYFSK